MKHPCNICAKQYPLTTSKITMNNYLAQMALVVRDYDEAIDFYTRVLGFTLIEDTPQSDTKRWVVVAPSADPQACRLLLAKGVGEEQQSRIGNQTGGRVFLFLYTDNFDAFFQRLQEHAVRIVRPPSTEPYGKVAVFADLYGNLWDLIEPGGTK